MSDHGPANEPRYAATGAAGRRSRYFVSYSRRSSEDSALADSLRAGLDGAGHEVFIDRGMLIGTDWVAEIEHHIDWCDFLVVLLSEQSIHSEMVLGEVRMAHHKRREDGRPKILPIRVRYDGPLDYELSSYLARIQYARWQGSADDAGVLNDVLAAADPSLLRQVAEDVIAFVPRSDDSGRPPPSAELRRAPGGNIRSTDPFYVRRAADDITDANASLQGETLAIKAPRQFGKSSLLTRYLAACAKAGKQTAVVDFQLFTDAELDHYPTLLSRLAEELLIEFDLDATQVPAIETQAQLTHFIERTLLTQVPAPLTIAFDEVDRVLGRSYQSDFFSMLRHWHNRRSSKPAWDSVDLALVIATEPHALIDSKDRSPFNVAVPVEPGAFDRKALDDLNRRYGSSLRARDLDALSELLGGHPFLTRLAFYRVATGEVASFAELEAKAAAPDGPFGDHLRSMLTLLHERSGLLPALRQVVARGSTPDDDTYYRLVGAGLVRRRDNRVIPANLLYARFFKNLT